MSRDARKGPLQVVAGFEPFAGRARNRSWEVVERIPHHADLERVRLPVDFERLPDSIAAILEGVPGVLLLVGEAPGREVLVEQVALNLADSGVPDNRGLRPEGSPLDRSAPLALRSSWDARSVASAIGAKGIPVEPSFHAGTYACNAALFLALAGAPPATAVGLVHVPRRRWPWGPTRDRLVRAVEIALESLSTLHNKVLDSAALGDNSI